MNGQRTPRKGYLIVFEGLDKSGKSTQSRMLLDYFAQKNQSAMLQRFPDRTTSTGSILNDYLAKKIIPGAMDTAWDAPSGDRTIHLLFSANRWEKMPLLLDKLDKGTHVILDRYAFSGVAFTNAKGYDFEWCKMPDRGLPKPDIVFYLDGCVKSLNEREDFGKEIYENIPFQSKVREIYKNFENSNFNWKVIDAVRDPDTVHREIVTHFQNLPPSASSTYETLW